MQATECDLLIDPEFDPCTQFLRLNEFFHEPDLVEACLEEEPREFCERFLAEISPAVEIVAARLVTVCEVLFIRLDVAGKAACDRPDTAGIDGIEQRRIGHEPYHTPVAVEERVYPCKAMMCGRGGQDHFRLAELAIGIFESGEETGQRPRTDWDMPADLDLMPA